MLRLLTQDNSSSPVKAIAFEATNTSLAVAQLATLAESYFINNGARRVWVEDERHRIAFDHEAKRDCVWERRA